MERDEKGDRAIFKVLVNQENEYSIWPADRENALGWDDAGKTGTNEECEAYIKEARTARRPPSRGNEPDERGNM